MSALQKIYKFAASLWLTLAIFVTLASLLAAATWLSGYDITVGALRRDLYGSWWFNFLLGLLMVNLVACTVRRKPWKFWQWGFLVTHAGVLVLLIGAGISFNWKIYGDMSLQEGRSAGEFTVEGERELVVRTSRGEERHRLDVNPYKRSKPAGGWPVKGAPLFVRIDEYVPSVSEETAYESAPDGTLDVLEIRATVGGQPMISAFLELGQTVGNELIQFSYQGGDEELWLNLSEGEGEWGTLALTMDGDSKSLDVKECLGKRAAVGKREVTIRQFFRSFSVGEDGRPEENPEAVDANPAVVFEVGSDGKVQTFYAFALRPDISPMQRSGGMHAQGRPDFTAQLRYSPRLSAVRFFSFPDGLRYAITTTVGKTASGPIEFGRPVRHPSMPMDFLIEVVRRIEKARPTVREEPPRKGQPTIPAVRVRVGDSGHAHAEWLRIGEGARFEVGGEPVEVHFQPKRYTELGFVVELVKFRNPPHEGTGRASKFESELRIHDLRTGEVVEGKTGVNYPFSYKGWVFYQSACNDRVQPVVSILQVSHDPGKKVLYLGCMMIAAGTIFMLFLKPGFVKLVQAAKHASGGMNTRAWLGYLILTCVGTAGGVAVLAAKPELSALAVGGLMAAVGAAICFALGARAVRLGASRPGFAVDLAQVVSAGWCLNSAALVLFMFLRVT